MRDDESRAANRAPASDLAPWIARLYVTKVRLEPGELVHCGIFADSASLRVQLRGTWSGPAPDGDLMQRDSGHFFGPNTRRIPVTIAGSFINLGVVLRPGACSALAGPRLADYLDRAAPLDHFGMPGPDLLARFDDRDDCDTLMDVMEQAVREKIDPARAAKPDPIIACFERISLAKPEVTVAAAARECGVDRRRLERAVLRGFGLSPKQVLRRARALDMASLLRGVVDSEEREQIVLRYYDESHLIREFVDLFGMSPRQFSQNPQPIMTIMLESRQSRRLEALERLDPGARRPWASDS